MKPIMYTRRLVNEYGEENREVLLVFIGREKAYMTGLYIYVYVIDIERSLNGH